MCDLGELAQDCTTPNIYGGIFLYEIFRMSVDLSEEEMRRALFDTADRSVPQSAERQASPAPPVTPAPAARRPTSGHPRSSKLRVTLRVTREFEGQEEIFTFDASTLSSLMAEQDARNAARKKGFKYIELVSVTSI
jgi:hypothetical protein